MKISGSFWIGLNPKTPPSLVKETVHTKVRIPQVKYAPVWWQQVKYAPVWWQQDVFSHAKMAPSAYARGESRCGTCGFRERSYKGKQMPRKKLTDPDQLLSRSLIIRVNEATYNRLENIRKESDCHSIAEVARRILSRQRIHLFHHDASLDRPMEELTRIRRELKAIGININQQTHRFHTSDSAAERAFYVKPHRPII